MVTLPDTKWRHREGMDALVAALGSGDARYVGGAVRDALLDIDALDVDIATRHRPEEVIERLRAARIKSVPTGIAHGTVTAVLPSGPVEVTTLRHDVATDGRHAQIVFTDDWRADAARRDFTINALYADPLTGEIFDYFGGLADLDARHIRFIGDPLARIAEDHLRILRFFRFLARFGDRPDADALAACTARARDLMALSRERIADELLKLLVARDAPGTLALMVDRAILTPVIPEIDRAGVDRLAVLARRETAAQVAPDPVRRLAALLPADAAINDSVGARLKLSNARRKRLASAIGSPDPLGPRALAYRIGMDSAQDRLLLSGASIDTLAGWTPPRLPIGGGTIVARGVARGPDVARLLRRIEDTWIAEGFPDAARVETLAAQVVDQWLSEESSRNA